ncbi:gas vesicle accessory protein GvpU [Metabacillus idriensis]|uniref:gas vesicle accessory protein GvpU n=1 Tax=Metabacillus idriensis TaxID=324768 RepID=UPI002813AEB8|nr:gas vesicle accessory protein GvpU [Metabacillus idriensis]MDR0137813.1 gas vesicle accessory protein GvpU [Metabacillus idriensis]
MRHENRQDPVLETLVITANHHDIKVNLLLTVDGVLVSGAIISAKEYLMECGKRFEKNEDDEAKLLSEKFYEASKGAGDHKAAAYIHLKNVQIKGNQVPSSSYWRCRIDDVSGFVIGN